MDSRFRNGSAKVGGRATEWGENRFLWRPHVAPFFFLALMSLSGVAEAARIKDIASIYGVRDNAVFGAGSLPVSIGRETLVGMKATIRTLANRLQGLGVTLQTDDIISRNVAVVMVTARIPSTAALGTRSTSR